MQEITDDFFPEGRLLQSEYWAKVEQEEKREVVQVKNKSQNVYGYQRDLTAVGSYGYWPRGFSWSRTLLKQVVELGKKKGWGWLRFDLISTEEVNQTKKWVSKHKLAMVVAPHSMQPRQNLLLDLRPSSEELLSKMKSKTRYNIRLAKRKGVRIKTTREEKYLDIFLELMQKTERRKGVKFHPPRHYYAILHNLPADVLQLYVAEYQGRILAINLVSFYNRVATYLHGATADNYRQVMAPFLLQWQAILQAKQQGCRYYDFGGIFPNATDSGKIGLTRFKVGFAPQSKPFVMAGSYDIILNPFKYRLYRWLSKVKKLTYIQKNANKTEKPIIAFIRKISNGFWNF